MRAGSTDGGGCRADGDDKARRRLLAGCQHQTMMIALGSVIPAVAESSAEDLQRTLQEIDEEPSQLSAAVPLGYGG